MCTGEVICLGYFLTSAVQRKGILGSSWSGQEAGGGVGRLVDVDPVAAAVESLSTPSTLAQN